MAGKKITVTRETQTGLNTHFNVPGRGEMTRGKLAREVDSGKHPGYHTRRLEGRRIIASNPDCSKKNNLG
jgi:hypothetical protein